MLLKFPELPPTLYAMQSGTDSPTQLCIELPDNYTPERKFPLFVFLYGGHGGPGAGAGRGQEIMERRDCIFVNLPLFKERIDPDGPYKGMMITPEQDGAAICSAYGAMLRKIYETVPNIDTSRNIIGGMSNGAHSIVAMFEHGDPYLMGLFQNLILIEGGFHAVKEFPRYRGKRMLVLYGDYAGQDDWLGKRMREQLPGLVASFTAKAAANGIEITGLEMNDTGHDMPPRFNIEVERWVKRQLGEWARLALPYPARMPPTIRPIEPRDLSEIRAELEKHWGSTEIWSLGHRHQADALPGFVAEADGAFAGLVTLHVDPGNWQCELITLSSRGKFAGTGAALLAAAERHARERGCRRIYLTTTNDNTNAMRFYQRHGWRMAQLHAGIVDRVRTLLPELPLTGFDGIQIRDEIEFERWLVDAPR